MENIELKELRQDDINKKILENFNRYQEVKRCYRKENGSWIIKNIEYIETWDKNKMEEKVKYFSNIINNGGYIFGAYENKKLVGFAVLLDGRFGSKIRNRSPA
jgi:hypothetical protein